MIEIIEANAATGKAVSVSQQLTGIQTTAIDLYKRGFNVFPIPSAWEWRMRTGGNNKKPPYLLSPFFTSRLHNCGPTCLHLPPSMTFIALFSHSNIGVMTGKTSGNLIGIDCDSRKAFETIGRRLTRRSLPFWAVSSHRGGTYLLRLQEGEATNMPETCFPDVQVWGNAHFLVLPPSIHPQGTVYRWVTPEPHYCLPDNQSIHPVSITVLDWLELSLVNQQRKRWQEPELHDLPEWTVVLSRRNRETLAFGVPEGQRNSCLVAAAYDLAGNDIPKEEAETVMLVAADRCVPPYSIRETKAILQCAYQQQRQPARKSGESFKPWKKAADFASSFDWRSNYGRVALKRRAVYLACVERAKMDNSDVWRASIRELSEMANQGTHGIQAALADFLMDELIKRVGRNVSGTNLYSFYRCTYVATVSPHCSNSVAPTDTPGTPAEKDLFGQLGLTSWHVWRFLVCSPVHKPSQIARALNLPRSSVYEALKRLQLHRLVIFNPAESLYYGENRTDGDLECLTINIGTFGKTEARKQMHRSEREKRCNILTAHARKSWHEHAVQLAMPS